MKRKSKGLGREVEEEDNEFSSRQVEFKVRDKTPRCECLISCYKYGVGAKDSRVRCNYKFMC